MMAEAARLYHLTGDRRYADWAASQLDFYADNWLRWPKGKNPGVSRLMWQSLDEDGIVILYAQVVRLLGDDVSKERRQRWAERLFRPEAEMLDASFQRIHNIACWQRSAVAQVGLTLGDERLWKGAIDGPFGIRQQVARGITGDYLWYEQSLHYNAYVVSSLLTLFQTAALAGRAGVLSAEMAAVEDLMLTPIAMRFPSGQTPNPADGAAPGTAPNLPLLTSAYRIFPTRLGLEAASHAFNWDTLLDPAVVSAVGPLPKVAPWSLESSRMAIIQSGPWQAYLHYGQLASSHWQAEALNYEAAYGQVQITHDPGTTGYGSPLTDEYYRVGVAHNVPLVDGQGQQAWAGGTLEGFGGSSVAASQSHYRDNAAAGRNLTLDGDRLLDRVWVRTTDGRSHALGFVLNLDGRVQLPPGFAEDSTWAARGASFGHWREVTVSDQRDVVRMTVVFGSALTLKLELRLKGPFRLWHGLAPDSPPKWRDALYVETAGTEAELTTTLTP